MFYSADNAAVFVVGGIESYRPAIDGLSISEGAQLQLKLKVTRTAGMAAGICQYAFGSDQ